MIKNKTGYINLENVEDCDLGLVFKKNGHLTIVC